MKSLKRPLHPATPPWLARAIVFTICAYWLSRGIVTAARALETLLVVVVLSFVFAAAFEVPVTWLAKRMRRGVAAALVLGLVAVSVLAFVAGTGVLVSSQVTTLLGHLPATFARAAVLLNHHLHTHLSAKHLKADISKIGLTHIHWTHVALSSVTEIGSLLMALLFTFYFVAEGPSMRSRLVSLVPADHQPEMLRALELSVEKAGSFFFSRFVLAAVRFAVALPLLLLCHTPEPFVLALWYALIAEFIPVVGALIATALPVIVALSVTVSSALVILITLTALTLLRDYALAPKLTRHTVKLHPILAFAGVIAAAILFGPLAALFAVPVLATITAFFSGYMHRFDVEVTSHVLPDVEATPPTLT